ncbi:LxmA leader domain family RiPP [Streptomyces sp. NPDC006385]
MNEQLIAGYTAYTTSEEFGAAASGAVPGTIFLSPFLSQAMSPTTMENHC